MLVDDGTKGKTILEGLLEVLDLEVRVASRLVLHPQEERILGVQGLGIIAELEELEHDTPDETENLNLDTIGKIYSFV